MPNEKRAEFRESVFARDNNTCVIPWCNEPAVDAHHIIERELWRDAGTKHGYILDNGASLCEVHHRHAEADYIPPQSLRHWSGCRLITPSQFDTDKQYTKWGVEIPGPNRVHIKYPHTPYFTFSPSADEKDIRDSGYSNVNDLVSKPLVITIKMDGSNLMMIRDKVAARNGYDAVHKSFDMAKSLHSKCKYMMLDYLQVFGEWLYAKHSIHYNDLDALFQVFAVYDQRYQLWYSWHGVEIMAKALGFITVPVVKKVTYDHDWELINDISKIGEDVVRDGHEGLVVRSIYPYHYGQFGSNVGKYVRPNHVQTDDHWRDQPIVKNNLVKGP